MGAYCDRRTLAPRILVPNHMHRNDVWVRVESGTIGVLVGDEVRTATAGQWALKPRGIEHAMWNPTDEPARVTEVLTPAGTERWFEEIAALADGDACWSFADVEFGCHGIEFHLDSPWIGRLRNSYGLT